MRRAPLCLAAVLCAAFASSQNAKLVNIVWDGAADWVVDRLLAEGKLPNVARLKAKGISAEASIPAWPSKTAVGHAAMFTGAWADVNGVANNSVPMLPCHEHTLDESMRGFDANAMLAEPIWVAAANAGRKVVALSAACSYPPEAFFPQLKDKSKFVEFSGFETTLSPAKMVRSFEGKASWTTDVAGTSFTFTMVDDPKDPVQGYDTVVVKGGGKSANLKPKSASTDLGAWSPGFSVVKDDAPGVASFRLFSLSPDGSKIELYLRAVGGLKGTESLADRTRYSDAYGGFHDDPFFNYQKGMFGTPLYKGGDGEAERRCLELVRQDCEFLKRSFDYGWKQFQPDVMFHYTPMSDSAGHTWMGALDPGNPGYDEAIAAKLWPFYEEVYKLQDAWLGHILDAVEGKAIVALMSDHGMAGVRNYFQVNTVLERAGLLVRDGNRIDWSKTKIGVPDWTDFFLVVNGTDRKGGIVPPEQRATVIEAARKALLSAVDSTGMPFVTLTATPTDFPYLGMGGPRGGDLYFELAPGYYPSNRASRDLVSKNGDEIGAGVHGFYPQRRTMHAIFYAAGPGLQVGKSIPAVRQIDIMPTLCAALGIPAPKNATGHSVGEALAKR